MHLTARLTITQASLSKHAHIDVVKISQGSTGTIVGFGEDTAALNIT